MRRLLALAAVLLSLLQFAGAQEIAVSIDGEPFSKKFIGRPPIGDKLVEFVRESESFDKWTKLVGFRYQQLSRIDNDPTKAAAILAQIVKASNPKAQSRVIVSKEKSEAMIDFLTWPPDRAYMEFNVFRYAKSTDGKAVVSLQLAYRFTDVSAEGLERFTQLRASWINQAAAFDMNIVHATLAQ